MYIRKIIFTGFLCLFFQNVWAQETEEADTVDKPPLQYNFSLMPAIEWASVPEDYFAHFGLELGMNVNNTYHVGIYGIKMLGKLTRRVIFPNVYEYDYYEYGGNVAYTIINEYDLYVIGELEVGYATAKWKELNESNYVLRDDFWVMKPGIKLEYHFAKIFGLGGKLDYRFSENIDLSGLDNASFNGITSSLYLKIGLLK